jgi:ribosome assembly protein 1
MVNFRSGNNDPVVAYVSKMVAIPESELPSRTKRTGVILSPEEARENARRKREEISKIQTETNGVEADDLNRVTRTLRSTNITEAKSNPTQERADPEHLIGFARIYSGTLRVGDSVYVLPPKFSPAHPHASNEPKKVTVTALYLFMGRNLEHLESVPAGIVFGVAGLEGHILKTGTLCSQLEGSVNLAGVSMASPPIVRVALEPVNPAELSKMISGLKLLEKSDPCAQYEVLPSGEHVILTAGELHLERCLKDLRERFAKCEIQVGEPIVPYRETIISAPEMAAPKNPDLPRGTVLAVSSSKQLSVRLRIMPLPIMVTEFLVRNVGTIKQLYSEKRAKISVEGNVPGDDFGTHDEVNSVLASNKHIFSREEFKEELRRAFNEVKQDREIWKDVVEKITEFGPRRAGASVLIDATPTCSCSKL